MKLLFIGDVVGGPGRAAMSAALERLSARDAYDAVIANGENAAGGVGITPDVASGLFAAGAHIITTGNHVWDKREALELLQRDDRIIRPMNYPPGVPGRGTTFLTTPGGVRIAVLNASGQVFMPPLDCPFRALRAEAERIRDASLADVVVVDFHAEATSEKVGMGIHLDGLVTAVVGTHTHVQTADEIVLPRGTAYITDVGMTGPSDSIIGMKSEQVLDRFLLKMPARFEVAKGPCIFNAVEIECDPKTGKAISIERIFMRDL